jgi:hypothetical protein
VAFNDAVLAIDAGNPLYDVFSTVARFRVDSPSSVRETLPDTGASVGSKGAPFRSSEPGGFIRGDAESPVRGRLSVGGSAFKTAMSKSRFLEPTPYARLPAARWACWASSLGVIRGASAITGFDGDDAFGFLRDGSLRTCGTAALAVSLNVSGPT